MSGVNVENALINERRRIKDELMRIDLKDSIVRDGKVYIKASEALKIIGYEMNELPVWMKK